MICSLLRGARRFATSLTGRVLDDQVGSCRRRLARRRRSPHRSRRAPSSGTAINRVLTSSNSLSTSLPLHALPPSYAQAPSIFSCGLGLCPAGACPTPPPKRHDARDIHAPPAMQGRRCQLVSPPKWWPARARRARRAAAAATTSASSDTFPSPAAAALVSGTAARRQHTRRGSRLRHRWRQLCLRGWETRPDGGRHTTPPPPPATHRGKRRETTPCKRRSRRGPLCYGGRHCRYARLNAEAAPPPHAGRRAAAAGAVGRQPRGDACHLGPAAGGRAAWVAPGGSAAPPRPGRRPRQQRRTAARQSGRDGGRPPPQRHRSRPTAVRGRPPTTSAGGWSASNSGAVAGRRGNTGQLV